MSILIENNSNNNLIPQIDSNDLLYDLAKINCKLNFIEKNKDFTFYENLKRLFSTNVSTFTLPSPNGTRLYYYVKYYEDNNSEKYTFSELSILRNMNITLYITIDEINKRKSIIEKYKNEIMNLKDFDFTRSRLIFLFDKEKNTKEYLDEKTVFFLNKGKKNLYQEISLIVSDLIVNGYVNYVKEIGFTTLNQKYTLTNINLIKQLLAYYIQIQKLKGIIKFIDRAINSFSGVQQSKFEEMKALVLFYIDRQKVLNGNVVSLNKDIIILINKAIIKYKNEYNYISQIEATFRLLYYYTNFPTGNEKSFEDCVKNLLLIFKTIKSKNDFENQLLINYLRLSKLYHKMGMRRRSNFFYYKAFRKCYYNIELKKMLPSMFKNISKLFNIYDVSNNIIESYNTFLTVHKYLVLYLHKPICITIYDKESNQYKLYFKKKYDKTNKIKVKNNLSFIKDYIFLFFWKFLQLELNSLIIEYYNNYENNRDKSIKYSLGTIQTLCDYIEENDKFSYDLRYYRDVSLTNQKKVFLNLSKIPFLMRIIPLSSEIKLDIIPNSKSESFTNKILIFNPWENKNKFDYYWTKNSYQKIKLELFNSFPFTLNISKIRILFKGIKIINYPTNIIIKPKSSTTSICNIKINETGILDILGIQYEIENSISVQYCDDNGNGLFYQFDNVLYDPLSPILKKEKAYLNNILVYPEIELLNYQILDNSFHIINGGVVLYEYQYYVFSFLLENVGKFNINELYCYVFVYKKNNFKITLNEIVEKVEIKPKENYVFNYKYWHRSIYTKIEFRLYYKSNEKSLISEKENSYIIKPYLFYSKNLETLDLINFSYKEIIPVISNKFCTRICKEDLRIIKSCIEFSEDDKKLITKCIQIINNNYNKKNTIVEVNEKMNETEKHLKKYKYIYCSDKIKVLLGIKNEHISPIQIYFIDRNLDKIINKEICESNEFKEISCEIDSNTDFEKIGFQWNFSKMDNINGEITLNQIFNEKIFLNQIKLINSFSLNIYINQEKDIFDNIYKSINFSIFNKTKEEKRNLRLLIYFYQSFEEIVINENKTKENYIYNENLKDNIFIDGNLSIKIPKIEPEKKFNYDITVYLNSKEIYYVTFLLIDHLNQTIFFCPYSKTLDIQ